MSRMKKEGLGNEIGTLRQRVAEVERAGSTSTASLRMGDK